MIIKTNFILICNSIFINLLGNNKVDNIMMEDLIKC
jgi:hypothetical protein